MKVSSIESMARALHAAGVPFLVVGGIAVVAHGYGRQTQDVDLVVPLDERSVSRLFAALASLGYAPRIPVTAEQMADAATRSRWIAERGMTVLAFHSEAHRETPIDVFVREPFDFESEHARAMTAEIAPGVAIRFPRLESLVRMKEAAGRPQDLADVAELRRIHGPVNPEASDG
jgi:predicted nucleotidyltransferase